MLAIREHRFPFLPKVGDWNRFNENTGGTFVVGLRDGRAISVDRIETDETVLSAGAHHGSTFVEHVSFRRAILDGMPAEVSAEDGLRAVAIGAAAERSIATGEPVDLAVLL